jgi:DNA-binding beta-propeller fold protein YncE
LTEDVQYLGNVSNFAGLAGSVASTNGVGTNSRFNNPHAISIAPDGIYALVVDRLNQIIRKIIISTAAVSTFAGVAGEVGNTNAIGTNSKFSNPFGVAISPDGVYALVVDTNKNQIRRIIISTALVTTFAGSSVGTKDGIGTSSQFKNPVRIVISSDGVYALVTEFNNHLVRHIVISTVNVTVFVGVNGSSGSTNGVGTTFKI